MTRLHHNPVITSLYHVLHSLMNMSKVDDAAFALSSEELDQIAVVGKHHDRRRLPGSKISDRMSVEAQLAMQMAAEDMRAETRDASQQTVRVVPSADGDDDGTESDVDYSSSESSLLAIDDSRDVDNCQRLQTGDRQRFTSLCGDGDARGGRMHGDIALRPDSDLLRPSDSATNLVNALEIIEMLQQGGVGASSRIDDVAIEELARINSVDKCRVWLQVSNADLRSGDEDTFRHVGENS